MRIRSIARLAVFDIDGTLCDTNAVDDACFFQAVGEFLGVEPSQIDWFGTPHVTDSGLLDWLCAKHRGNALDAAEIDFVINRFLELLRAEASSAPDRFRAIPGAAETLDCLPSLEWDVALATGGWKHSAQFKVREIGLDPDRVILATANDATARSEIIQIAIRRAQVFYGRSYMRIVSVGDAPWDVRTAAELDLPFVGIGSGDRMVRLREAGAATILEDLTDLHALEHALEHALVPVSAKSSVSA